MPRIRAKIAEIFAYVCPRCRKSFETKKETSKYCSRSCALIYRNSPSHEPGTPEKTRLLSKIYREKRKDYYNNRQREYRKKHMINPEWMEKERQYKRNYNKNMRIKAFMAYGGLICSCDHHGKPCGPHPFEFLSMDHINGEGITEGARDGNKLITYLKKLGYPPGYRVLCQNCNSSLGHYGRCPMSDTESQQRWKTSPGNKKVRVLSQLCT